MDRTSTHIDTAKQAEFRQRMANAQAEATKIAADPNSPDHAVWAAQAKVDLLEREYDAYVQSFQGTLG